MFVNRVRRSVRRSAKVAIFAWYVAAAIHAVAPTIRRPAHLPEIRL